MGKIVALRNATIKPKSFTVLQFRADRTRGHFSRIHTAEPIDLAYNILNSRRPRQEHSEECGRDLTGSSAISMV